MNTDPAPATPTPTKKWWQRWWVWLLIVLLVLPVLLFITLLGGLAIVRMKMGGNLDAAAVATVHAQISSLNVALLTYRSKAGVYPTQEQGLQALITKPTTPPIPAKWAAILETVPRDPWNHPFVYRIPNADPATPYELFSLGPDGVPSADDIGNSP